MDWIAAIFTIIGIELLRRKMWQGFLVGLLNEISWAYIAINKEVYGLLLLVAVLSVQYSWAIYTWRKSK
jgi:nicotinamide riboside transporter PnuC